MSDVGQQPQQTPQTPPTPAVLDKDAKTWGMLCHLSALAGIIIPFGFILGPLVVWLVKKQEYPFVEDQGKEALNFQISMAIYLVGALLLCFVIIGLIILPVVAIADLVFTIIASIKASNGEPYRYPLTIRFIK
jgi:uncharacterized Tic20 family protein